eukprot:GHVS01047904.1.p1 GENE.GHVS01047904.1~~GHVS01047904.1.p1  ORF type:complete len:649 (-),score=115.51 GHVS01047904.1:204-2150(-)
MRVTSVVRKIHTAQQKAKGICPPRNFRRAKGVHYLPPTLPIYLDASNTNWLFQEMAAEYGIRNIYDISRQALRRVRASVDRDVLLHLVEGLSHHSVDKLSHLFPQVVTVTTARLDLVPMLEQTFIKKVKELEEKEGSFQKRVRRIPSHRLLEKNHGETKLYSDGTSKPADLDLHPRLAVFFSTSRLHEQENWLDWSWEADEADDLAKPGLDESEENMNWFGHRGAASWDDQLELAELQEKFEVHVNEDLDNKGESVEEGGQRFVRKGVSVGSWVKQKMAKQHHNGIDGKLSYSLRKVAKTVAEKMLEINRKTKTVKIRGVWGYTVGDLYFFQLLKDYLDKRDAGYSSTLQLVLPYELLDPNLCEPGHVAERVERLPITKNQAVRFNVQWAMSVPREAYLPISQKLGPVKLTADSMTHGEPVDDPFVGEAEDIKMSFSGKTDDSLEEPEGPYQAILPLSGLDMYKYKVADNINSTGDVDMMRLAERNAIEREARERGGFEDELKMIKRMDREDQKTRERGDDDVESVPQVDSLPPMSNMLASHIPNNMLSEDDPELNPQPTARENAIDKHMRAFFEKHVTAPQKSTTAESTTAGSTGELLLPQPERSDGRRHGGVVPPGGSRWSRHTRGGGLGWSRRAIMRPSRGTTSF